MEQTVRASSVKGTLQAPASKSVVQRALAAALLSKGNSTLNGYTPSDDAIAAIGIIKQLGATINHITANQLNVTGNNTNLGNETPIAIHCGESGLSSRLFAPVSALFSNHIELHGEGSLLKRPFNAVQSPFLQLGIQSELNGVFLPLKLNGRMTPGNITVDGSGGSQFLTGLLMSLPLLNGDSVINVTQLQSKPYIDLTIEVLNQFGITIHHENYERFPIKGNQQYTATNYNMEGDWSGASCLLAAGAIAGEVEITNLKAFSRQADKAIVDALKASGAFIQQSENSIMVRKNDLKAFSFDATHCPDLFPALVVLAANCDGITRITGAHRLINKESNRAKTLQEEFNKLGITIDVQDDIMLIHGGNIHGGRVFAHNDHRIAMALGVAGLTATVPVTVENSECINKSYPLFFEDLAKIINK